MEPTTYLLIHFVGLATLTIGLGGMFAGGEHRKLFSLWQGIGLLLLLVSGFGLLAKLKLGFPHFAIVKVILWFALGMFPLVVRKAKLPMHVAILITLVLVGALAWLGLYKPAIW